VFVRSVGTKALVFVIWAARYVPFRTWYWRIAFTRPGSEARAAPAEELSSLAKALFDGARMVMFCAEPSCWSKAGFRLMNDVRLERLGCEANVALRDWDWTVAMLARAKRERCLNCIMAST
jgi:hypothetical protein